LEFAWKIDSDSLLTDHLTMDATPPDGRAHIILRVALAGLRRKGYIYSHRFPREPMHLITGHAFVGAYRLKFKHKSLPPATEEVACVCAAVPEDDEELEAPALKRSI
jgi:hypothetical protein